MPSLIEMLGRVVDPRSRHGRSHELFPILCLAVVAILAGRNTLQGIAQFGRDHGVGLAHALGFRRAKTPCGATLSRLFRRLDIDALEAVLQEWILERCPDLGCAWTAKRCGGATTAKPRQRTCCRYSLRKSKPWRVKSASMPRPTNTKPLRPCRASDSRGANSSDQGPGNAVGGLLLVEPEPYGSDSV